MYVASTDKVTHSNSTGLISSSSSSTVGLVALEADPEALPFPVAPSSVLPPAGMSSNFSVLGPFLPKKT